MKITDIQSVINNTRGDNAGVHTSTERALWNILLNEVCKIGEIKMINMDSSTIKQYFDNTGLAIPSKEYDGFAICNGNNGTIDFGKRSPIGAIVDDVSWGTSGVFKGTATNTLTQANLPPLTFSYDKYFPYGGTNGGFSGGDNNYQYINTILNLGGTSAPIDNVHPSFVVFYIQRIS